jgi:glycosyltransferase involved in cell wall biosynthesis
MKAIQSVARYFPDKCGGIQVHLSELTPEMLNHGVESKIAASQDSSQEDTYEHNGVEVYRYPVFPEPKPEPNYGQFPHGSFELFASWLKEQKADIYNQHQWTPKCGLPHLRLAKELNMATVVTVHLPIPICQRHTLMLYGQEACDGKIDQVRCSHCCSVPRSLPSSVVNNLSRTPIPVSLMARGLLRRSSSMPIEAIAEKLLSPFVVPTFVAARQHGLQEMARFADRIVAVCEWLYEALLINGIPREKLVLCRYGIPDSFQKAAPKLKQQTRPLRVGFLGRWSTDKGIHILVEALRCLPPDVPIELVIHAVGDNEPYRKQISANIANDNRIHIAQPLGREELPSALASFDVLAVPSQWLETGPLVVLEAHASGTPVLGSNLGGIAELVRHDVDGLLIPPSDIRAWTDALARLAVDANLLNKLRQGIRPVRSISTEAADTAALYRSISTGQPSLLKC